MRQGKVITNDDAARLHEDLLKQVEDIFELCTSGMHANGGATRDARKIQVSHRQCIPGRPSASAWCGLYSKQHPLGQNSSSPGGGACTVPMSSSSSSARIHGHHRRQCIYTGNALTHVCPGMKTVEPRVAGHPGVQAPPQSQLLTGYGGAGELTGDAKVRRAHRRCQTGLKRWTEGACGGESGARRGEAAQVLRCGARSSPRSSTSPVKCSHFARHHTHPHILAVRGVG